MATPNPPTPIPDAPFRTVTLRLPDTSDPAVKAEYRRQLAAIAEHDRESNFADRVEPSDDDLLGWV
jgi:hypothetical protein